MSLVSLRLLAGLAVMIASSAQAFNQPGASLGTYTAHVRYQTETPNPSDPAIHLYNYQDISISTQTLDACQTQYSNAMNVAITPTFQIVGSTPCRWGMNAAGSLVAPVLDPGSVGGVIRTEEALRERFRIDLYEAELIKLYNAAYRVN